MAFPLGCQALQQRKSICPNLHGYYPVSNSLSHASRASSLKEGAFWRHAAPFGSFKEGVFWRHAAPFGSLFEGAGWPPGQTEGVLQGDAEQLPCPLPASPRIRENNCKTVDRPESFCYNNLRWFGSGEMAEWFKALVLKTSDAERHRGFESLSLRQFHSRGEVPKRPKGLPC